MTNSGLRTVDYASGHSNRVTVAARRAVSTGMNQVVGKINEENAEKLGTNYFEVSWYSGARPSHQVWQGRVYSKEELESVCGLGTVTGLCGANCYHSYSPFTPGITPRTYTDEQLDKMNAEENKPVEYNGKTYTKYEATQRQRRLETEMRAQRQKIKLLEEGEADEQAIINARARYVKTSDEYVNFSKSVGLSQQWDRVTVGSNTVKGITRPKKAEMPLRGMNSNKHIAKSVDSGIIKTDKQFGKMVGKHAIDWGLNPSSAEDRKALENIIDDIYTNHDVPVRTGEWRGQKEDVLFYIKGEDVVITKKNGEFVTVMKGGVNNGRVKNSREL